MGVLALSIEILEYLGHPGEHNNRQIPVFFVTAKLLEEHEPGFFGIMTSRMTRSGLSLSIFSNPSLPLLPPIAS